MRPAPSWHAKARELQAKGLSNAAIAERLGRSAHGIRMALDDEARARNAAWTAARDAELRARRNASAAP